MTDDSLSGRLQRVATDLGIDPATPEGFEAEIRNLREKWVCTEPGCTRTPDNGKSGDIYAFVCHGCGRCMMHASTACTICGDRASLRQRVVDIESLVEQLAGLVGDYERGAGHRDLLDSHARTLLDVVKSLGLHARVTFSG
jgi:hypothetical protein